MYIYVYVYVYVDVYVYVYVYKDIYIFLSLSISIYIYHTYVRAVMRETKCCSHCAGTAPKTICMVSHSATTEL